MQIGSTVIGYVLYAIVFTFIVVMSMLQLKIGLKPFKIDVFFSLKAILEADSQNYYALIYLGVSHEKGGEYSEAEKHYETATSLLPGEILAWQGLNSLYAKKSPVDGAKHILVLKKLLDLLGK